MLEAVHEAAARQACLDPIDDHDAGMAPALFERLEKTRRRQDQPRRHQRLDEDGRHLFKRAGRLKLVVEHRHHGLGAEARVVGIG